MTSEKTTKLIFKSKKFKIIMILVFILVYNYFFPPIFYKYMFLTPDLNNHFNLNLNNISEKSRNRIIRNCCYRTIIKNFGNSHDSYVYLIEIGDKTSIPYLIYSLLFTPKGGGACTWDHNKEALVRITNQGREMDYLTWALWYSKNHHKSRYEWIVDGFRQRNYKVSLTADYQSLLNLLNIISHFSNNKESSVIDFNKINIENAKILIEHYELDKRLSFFNKIISSGSQKEKINLEKYFSITKNKKYLTLIQKLKEN